MVGLNRRARRRVRSSNYQAREGTVAFKGTAVAMIPSPESFAANKLLAALAETDLDRLAPQMKHVTLHQGTVLYNPGDDVEHVYFPTAGMVSHAILMEDGRAIETATIGREGAVGALVGLGAYRPITRAMAQLPLAAWRISAPGFRAAAEASRPLREIVLRGAENLLVQAQITAGCNALHTLEQRVARWILHTHDRSDEDSVRLTQELLSQALGATRSSVSEVAGRLQARGIIHYSRGNIDITDRAALERAACECYGAIARRLSRV